jgi:hypothetical protein
VKTKIVIAFFLFNLLQQARSQNNWASVPCYSSSYEATKMFVDSLHNEIILSFRNDYKICNVNFKGLLAYNGSGFRDLDFGIDKHNPNLVTSGDMATSSVPFNGKTLIGGFFASVGSNTLYSEAMALWNGTVWDTFPKFTFTSNPQRSGTFPVVNGFLRDNGKLWIYGSFKNLGGVSGNNIYTYDGNNFTAVNIPISDFGDDYPVFKMIKYKNQIYALGNFGDYPSNSISRLAKYDGTGWSSVGNGIVGSIDNAAEMVIYNDTLYIAGTFSKASGNIGNYIMKWDGTQLRDAGFGNFYGWYAIWKLVVYKNRLFAFGNFPYAGSQKAFGVAYYENGHWTAPSDSINGIIKNAVVYKDELYIAGGFNIIGNQTIKNFAKLRCPDFDNVCTTDLEKNTLKDFGIKLYPNPVNNKLYLEYDYKANIDKITITNTLGQEVLFLNKAEQEIDLSFLPKGVYYLSVKNSLGHTFFKVIKE